MIAEKGSADMAQLLLDSGADPTHLNIDGASPLDTAVNYKNMDVIKVLVKAEGN
jgi:ankyrin repeat protein